MRLIDFSALREDKYEARQALGRKIVEALAESSGF